MQRIFKILVFLLLVTPNLSIIVSDKYNDSFNIFNDDQWAKDQLAQMNLDEKIGQVFMVPVYTERPASHKDEVLSLVQDHHIGGVIFMKGHPHKQFRWTKELQDSAKIPLFVAMDAEWGLRMRLDSTLKYPKQMTLGAIADNSLIRKLGNAIGDEMQSIGVNISFSPVVDINSNPMNPVIHMRSFGENKYDVADKAIQYAQGLQEKGILAVAKHFPGHGDTHIDSHLDLPLIEHSKRRLATTELYPFKRIFEVGVAGTMTAHLRIPSLQKKDTLPASLSERVVKKLLIKDYGFQGLVFSDALNMKGVTRYVPENMVDVAAIKAGNDVLLFPKDIVEAKKNIKYALEQGELSERELDHSVLKILKSKRWIHRSKTTDFSKARKEFELEMTKGTHKALIQSICDDAVTILGKEPQLFKTLDDTLLLIQVKGIENSEFQKNLELYAPVKRVGIEELSSGTNTFKKKVIALFGVNPYKVKSNFGYHKDEINLINSYLDKNPSTVLVNFGTPYMLRNTESARTIVQAYEILPELQKSAAAIIYGGTAAKGTLPVGTSVYRFGEGEMTGTRNILSYGFPEQVGLSSQNMARIDSIVLNAIKKEAAPGCQVLIAKDGKIVYHKAFGHHTYDSTRPVLVSDLYDIASITKVVSSTMLTMRLYEHREISLEKTLYEYLKEQVDSSKMDLSLKEILTHQSGLSAWIPFYKYTLNGLGFCDSNYCYAPNSDYSLQVAESLFVRKAIKDTIYNMINRSKMKNRGEYLYSDLGYFYLMEIIDSLIDDPIDEYLEKAFLEPMGMTRTLYNPLKKYSRDEIVPTEVDDYFRQQLVHGYVHDPAAAMLGGVAGHAGVFSNANDLAKLFQMFLQRGEYNQTNFLQPSTISEFTSVQFENNRKGLGFDKPEKRKGVPGPAIRDMSKDAFGHTGFTGTCVWADPAHNLVYVFLSNRIHPKASNTKLIKMNVRTDILQVVYDDLLNKVP